MVGSIKAGISLVLRWKRIGEELEWDLVETFYRGRKLSMEGGSAQVEVSVEVYFPVRGKGDQERRNLPREERYRLNVNHLKDHLKK